MLDPMNYRNDFPILQNKTQLSSCSQSALHTNVKNAVVNYLNIWEQDGADWGGWMEECESARQKFAKLINADPTEVSIVSSVSHAASAISTTLMDQSEKKDVVTTTADFPCIGHVWLSQNDRNVSFIEPEDGIIPLEKYEQAITDDTLITSVSHVSYYNGFKQDLSSIADIVHQKGGYFFVDAYQSAGQANIDVKESEVDFLTAGMQKYLLGTPGLAFLYVKKNIAEQLTPLITGWFGQKDPFAFNIQNVDYASGAIRFDTGTFPMINGYAANAGLDVLLNVGVKNIEEYLSSLSEYALGYAGELGLEVKSPNNISIKGSNTAIHADNASQIEAQMAERNFIVSARADVVRISPHFYNKKSDIKNALDALKELL